MTESPTYEVEHETTGGFREFAAKRWVRITGASVGAAVVLVGTFGVGVLAGERIAGNGQPNFSSQGGFGGQNGFPGNGGFNGFGHDDKFGQGVPQGGFPGGCPANDPDHCAGKDRNNHGFQLPSGAPTPAATSGAKS